MGAGWRSVSLMFSRYDNEEIHHGHQSIREEI